MAPKFKVDGKTVLITGAAHGLGRELCLQFLSRGAFVVATDRDAGLLKKLTEDSGSSRLFTQKLDVLVDADVQALKEELTRRNLRVDILVNNAGIVHGGPFLQVALDQHLRTIEVNLLGLIRLTHAFLSDLRNSRQACLLNIGSVTGMMGLAYGSTYSSSKWGVLGFSESLRQELRSEGDRHIHVLTVCPSYISTGMFEGSGAPKFMPFLNSTQLAEKILRALESKCHFVREPFLVKTLPFLRTLLPLRVQDWLLDWFGVAKGMAQWKGHGH